MSVRSRRHGQGRPRGFITPNDHVRNVPASKQRPSSLHQIIPTNGPPVPLPMLREDDAGHCEGLCHYSGGPVKIMARCSDCAPFAKYQMLQRPCAIFWATQDPAAVSSIETKHLCATCHMCIRRRGVLNVNDHPQRNWLLGWSAHQLRQFSSALRIFAVAIDNGGVCSCALVAPCRTLYEKKQCKTRRQRQPFLSNYSTSQQLGKSASIVVVPF